MRQTIISIKNEIEAPITAVWQYYTRAKHITQWNYATEEWHCPTAEVDLRSGGLYRARMEAKDGSMGFDFEAVIDEVIPEQKLTYTIADGRKVNVQLSTLKDKTHVEVTFEAEQINPIELQEAGWQAILNQFKKYAEMKQQRFERLHFQIRVAASAEHAYRTMLGLDAQKTYEEWTKVFEPTSSYRGTWEAGTTIYFTSQHEGGEERGMISRIVAHEAGRFVSILHYGILKEGKEITEGPEVEAWTGGYENYKFSPAGDETLIEVDIDMTRQYADWFRETYPKALERLKEIIEA